jgi:hypothetical protein
VHKTLPNKFIVYFKILSLILCTLALFSCSSQKNPVIYQSTFNFSAIKQYSFYLSDSPFYSSQSLSHDQRNRIEIAIEKALNKKDLTYTDPANADIIVTYYITKGSLLDYQTYNKVVRFCAACLKANTWQQHNNDWHFYTNGLIIDLVNPTKERSVWRSISPLKFDTKDSGAERNKKIINAVNVMLEQYIQQ